MTGTKGQPGRQVMGMGRGRPHSGDIPGTALRGDSSPSCALLPSPGASLVFCPHMNAGDSWATGRSWSHRAERHRGEWAPLCPIPCSSSSTLPDLCPSDTCVGIG